MESPKIVESFGLSPMQEGMLFDALHARSTGMDVTCMPLELEEELDRPRFEGAWREAFAQYGVLRAAFRWRDREEPIQDVYAEVPLPMRHEDWSPQAPEERERRWSALFAEERRRGFDLATPPLTRLVVVRFEPGRHRVLWVVHHALLDSLAMNLVLAQVFGAYDAAARGERRAFEDLPGPGAYLAWLAGRDPGASRAFFETQLSGIDGPTRLGLEEPEDSEASAGEPFPNETRVLDEAKGAALREFARACGVPLHTLVHAAWALLLARYAGERRVVFGVVKSARNAPFEGAARSLGLLLNAVPFVADADPEREVAAWLGDLRQRWRALRAHEATPLSRIREWSGAPGRPPLYESLLTYDVADFDAGLRAMGCAWDRRHADLYAQPNVPVSVNVYDGARITVRIVYDPRRFARAAIARLQGHLGAALDALASGAGRRVGDLTILRPGEERALLSLFRGPDAPDANDRTIHGIVAARAARAPEAVAVSFEGASLRYRELRERARHLAGQLRARGVRRGEPVGLCVERGLGLVPAILGILEAGGAYVPLDPALPAERLRHALEDTGARWLLTARALLGRIPTFGGEPLCVEDLLAAPAAGEGPAEGAGPGDLAYVLHTSGSTGRPKGVEITHGSVANFLASMAREPGIRASDVLLAVTTISFDIAGLELFLPLSVGARVEIASREAAADGALLRGLLASSGATILQATPATWQLLLHAEWEGNRGLTMLCGGEELPRPLAEALLARGGALWNLYGPTETTIWSAVARVEPLGAEAARHPERHPVDLGAPIARTQLLVLDGDLRPVPRGVAGELHIAGAGLARGYWKQPALTAERFVPSPWPEVVPGRLYKTGDLVRVDEAGRLRFLGRRDHQVKIRGFRIELGEIEATLAQAPGVREAAVLARADEPGEKQLVAYVAGGDGAGAEERLRALLRERLPDYMVPRGFVFLERLPRGTSGKVDRRALPAPRLAPASRATAPRNPTEAGVGEICGDLLRRPRLGPHDDFFALGGHSLLAARLVSRLRKQFQVEVRIQQIFDHPTVAGIAESVEAERRAGRRDALPPLRRGDPSEAPLSFTQADLWFMDRLGAGAAYNMQLILRLTGALDAKRLARSLGAVVARHAALRTRFPEEEGAPRALVEDRVPVELAPLDRSAADPKDREAALQALAAEELLAPFDLAAGPPFRARLARFADDDHALVVTLHHIVCDAGSLGILQREIAAHYAAFAEGRDAPLPELPVQYGDFARWEREWLRGGELDRLLGYWRAKLAGGLAPLQLPSDRARGAARSFRGASRRFELDARLSGALRALAREQGVTLPMLLLAAYQALLARFTGQEEIVLGSPIANRRQPEVEGLIGPFVNAVVLRGDLSGDPSFPELLARVRALSLEAYDHRDAPLEKVVEALGVERDLARSPLFQATFAIQDAPGAEPEAAGLSIRPVIPNYTTARFELELHVFDGGEALEGTLCYDADLFEPEFADGLARRYAALLGALADDPQRKLSELPLLLAGEREALLGRWNRSAREYPRDRCVHELFDRQAARTPGALAVRFGEERATYAELARRANGLARTLVARGVRPGDLVGVCLERGLGFVVALLGILKAGGAYVPMDSDFPAARLAAMLADARPRALLTQQNLLPRLPEFDGAILCLDAEREPAAVACDAGPGVAVGPGDLAYVVYTSGSTGKPKGVCVPHRAIVRLVLGTDYVVLDRSDGVAQASNASFDAATFEIWGALLSGAVLVGVEKRVLLSPPELAEQIRRESITVLFVTTALFNQLSLGAPGIFSPLRSLLFGGEAVDPARVRAVLREGPPRRLLHVYGPTENTTFSTWFEVKSVPERARTVPIGGPIANTTCHVLDDRGALVPVGAPGELHLGGDGLATGYLGDPQLSARKFVPDPFAAAPGERLYRTGDRVRRRADGAIEFLGRTDHQVKLRGFRIELGDVEAALAATGGVREAAVLCREDEPGGRRLVAYLVPEAGAELARIREALARALPEYMLPSGYVLLEAMPLNANGKVNRAALPRPAPEAGERTQEYVAPRTPSEARVAALWGELLGAARVGANDHFFALGGHSLMAMRALARLRSEMGLEVPLQTLFDAPTVAAFAERLDLLAGAASGTAGPRAGGEREEIDL